jgi:DNA polymerase-3 subunit gamma/tau
MAKKKVAPAEEATLLAPPPEEYTVLARRYRPQQFSDLIGQEGVAQALTNALKSNRVAHAYLFTGMRGVGKTTAARILAKCLNCVEGPTPTPCNNCESCRAIAAGEDLDVLEIDGASNNKVEEVRELRQNIGVRPARSRYKIYIIDEVHMLSTSAFNALLKTLEEPPPHVKFIFATTEVQKIPVTILSRCQRFDFTGINSKRIQERLQGILNDEKMQAEPDVLELIARRSGGSMRDAQSLLDQIVAFGGDKISLERVHRLLGTADEDQVVRLAAAILKRDLTESLRLLGEALEAGVQQGELLDQLLEFWRDMMLVRSAGPGASGLSFSARHREQIQSAASGMSLDSILAGLDVLIATKSRLRSTSHGRVLLEMAVVRLARLEELLPLPELARQLTAAPGAHSSAAPVRLDQNRAAQDALKKKLVDSAATAPSAPVALSVESLDATWARLLGEVGGFLGVALEKGGIPAISAPNCLVLRFSSAYNKEREQCEEPTRKARIEDALGRITGQRVAIRFEAMASDGNAEPVPPRQAPAGQMRRLASEEPLVQAVMEHLGASLVRAEDGFGAGQRATVEEAS